MDSEPAEERERTVTELLFISGVVVLVLVPVVFILVVWNTMEEGDCIPGSGPCPTGEGIAIGATGAGVLFVIAFVLLWLAVSRGFGQRRNKRGT